MNHHSTPWHPWQDKPGYRHISTYFKDQAIWSANCDTSPLFHVPDLDTLETTVCQNGLFLLVHDLLSEREFPFADDLIGRGDPYFTKAGNIPVMRLSQKRKTGLLVPASTWCWDMEPNRMVTETVGQVFKLFGYEAATPSSLSEKVLRGTLGKYVGIYRPSVVLRRDILVNHTGGRIDRAIPAYYKEVKEFDKNKAYLWHSRNVPSPYICPVHRSRIRLDAIMDYPTGYWHVAIVARHTAICPVQLDGQPPVDGEVISKWLWTEELQDCIEAGYQFLSCDRGWGFRVMSNFMVQWSEILWSVYEWAQKNGSELLLRIIKQMMVGVPGRFLRQPEQFTLIPWKEIDKSKGDIPLMLHPLMPGDKHFSNWGIRPSYDMESTALSPQGSYIVMMMRHELYQRMLEETLHGNHIVRSYIDSYSVSDSCPDSSIHGISGAYRNVGAGMGQWKQKTYTDVWAEENRLVGLNEQGIATVKAPGFERNGTRRLTFLQKYRRMVEGQMR